MRSLFGYSVSGLAVRGRQQEETVPLEMTAKCVLSAAAGSILTLLAVCPTSVPLGLSKNAWAQQGKTSGVKASAAPLQASANVKLEDENIAAHYANFARVTATPEEVI